MTREEFMWGLRTTEQDAFLKQAVVNRDDIREMVAKLGEGK